MKLGLQEEGCPATLSTTLCTTILLYLAWADRPLKYSYTTTRKPLNLKFFKSDNKKPVILCFFRLVEKQNILQNQELMINKEGMFHGGRGHWADYYTSPQSHIITFYYSLV